MRSFLLQTALLTAVLLLTATSLADEAPSLTAANDPDDLLSWNELPRLPDELGVAGPFAGVHTGVFVDDEKTKLPFDVLIVAGGANFPKPVWENDKAWNDAIHVLVKTKSADGEKDIYTWNDGGELPRATGYGAAVSTPDGVLCMGGNHGEETFDQVYLLSWNPKTSQVEITDYPALPLPCAYGAATRIGNTVYLAGGQSDSDLHSAMNQLWSLDLSKRGDHYPQVRPRKFAWKKHKDVPWRPRAFNLAVTQHNGFHDCVYVMSGRRQDADVDRLDGVEFLTDVWEFSPKTNHWRQRAELPRPMVAGTAIDYKQSHIFVLSGADGSMWGKADALQDDHPGFPKNSYAYHTITDTWIAAGSTPSNQVTTIAVKWGDAIIIPSGEVRPRVRSSQVWSVNPKSPDRDFGLINYVVLFGYLLTMVAVGVYFTNKNKSTDDFFRGGGNIPWWAAGCSIFATMLSSLTFTGIPSKAYAQDWVYAVGNFMIPVVAIIAVFVAMPFFRRIDATSAYEYLEKRFNFQVRMFGSASFTLFHIFRMAVVMSLTGLALAVATPLTPAQSVLLMGLLSIIYCTLGGIEAVIWTDTIQTFVLMGGALLAICLLIFGTDGGLGGFLSSASAADKLNIANFHWDVTNAQLAIWVIVIGAIAQNISSYTADQAVVQRYMTTPTQQLAARAIWTNAILSIPATLLFFGIGTALFAFYHSHPDKLDPTINTDQIFPLFIAREMPIGLAGLIVAGVFAAAQSTVSTSMNSTATSIVTDFMRPFNMRKTERGYLNAARVLTFSIGVLGTLIGLVFVDPNIKSLFDTFISVIGLFMGVLGGLFVLGATTRRANGAGALIGALVGAGVMICLWKLTNVQGYLYTATGIGTCFVVGYLASLVTPGQSQDLTGLTIYTLTKADPADQTTAEESQ